MDRKKVLIIVYYWPPAGGGGVQRWVKFVKYLREFGWEPVVYTAAGADYPILDPVLESDIPEGIEIIRQKIIEPYSLFKKFTGKKADEKLDPAFLSEGKKFGWKERLAVWVRGNIFIPDARCLWIRPSVNYLTRYLKTHKTDVLVTSGPPHSCHVIGLQLKERLGLPWLADFRDQWTQIDYFDDLRLTSYARKKHKSLEKKVLDNADCVLTVGPELAKGLRSISQTRIEIITNGFDESDRSSGIMPLAKESNILWLTYIGTINDAQNPLVLWEALNKMKASHHPIYSQLKIRIVGKAEQQVLKSIHEAGISDIIEYTGYVSHKEAIGYQNTSDVLLLLINRTKNNKAIVTGKLFEYLDARKPILCIGPEDGDAAAIIRDAGAGIICDYEDPDDIIRALEKLCTENLLNPADRNKILKYSRRNLTAGLSEILHSLLLEK
ncbi:MAG: glycosyltransferase family 4 protein [Saprospiraceae bacterium]|nr:glycosyltransferase family 4 protein [Saprospiraceae bacterium]